MSKVVCRIIIPTAFAGNIFGKKGSVLNEMRDTFNAKISIPNSDGPERNVYVESSTAKDVASCTVALTIRIQDDMQKINRSLGDEDIELRMLLHTSQAGHVIGHKGDNITALRNETNCKIKLHSLKCPMSTDRICQLSGSVANVTSCLDKILADLKTTPLEGNVIQYDANMYNEREEYGGFKSWHIENATGKTWRGTGGRGGGGFDDRRNGGAYGGGDSSYRQDRNGMNGGNGQNGRYDNGDGPGGFGGYNPNNDNSYDNRGNSGGYRANFNNNDRNGGFGGGQNRGYDRGNSGPGQRFGGNDMSMPRANYDDPNEEDKVVCRLLIPTRLAGALIGKRGETVNRMRMEFSCEISIPTSTSSERTLRVMSTEHKNVVSCIKAMLDEIGEELKRSGRIIEEDHTEVRMLMHTSHAGYVIGQGGKNIKSLRTDTGCRIIINTEHCPYSTDRVCQISGTPEEVMNCVDRVLVMIDETPIKGEKKRYNANFANDKIDYGGYKSGPRRTDNKRYSSGDNRDNLRDDIRSGGPGPSHPQTGYHSQNNGGGYNPGGQRSDDDRGQSRYGNGRNDRYNQEPRGGYGNNWDNNEQSFRPNNFNNNRYGNNQGNGNNGNNGYNSTNSYNNNNNSFQNRSTGYKPNNGPQNPQNNTNNQNHNQNLNGHNQIGNANTGPPPHNNNAGNNGYKPTNNGQNEYKPRPGGSENKFMGGSGRDGNGVKKVDE